MYRNALLFLSLLAAAGCGQAEESQPEPLSNEEVGEVQAAVTNNGACIPFNDVFANHEAWTEIQALASAGVTRGCTPGNFCPGDNVTRAEMAVFLIRAKYGASIDSALPTPTSNVFNDIPPSYWAAKWIKKALDDRLTSGCGNNNYCPEQRVSRSEMAVFTQRLRGVWTQPGMRGIYADVPWGYWSGGWIENAAEYFPGCGRSGDRPNFCPERSVTRSEMAQLLTRIYNYPVPCRNVTSKVLYTPFEVIPSISVASHLGMHWGTEQQGYNDIRERDVLRRIKQQGVGYVVILVQVGNPWAMNATIQRIRQEGMTPVVRLVWTFGQSFEHAPQSVLDQHISAASALYDMGVRIVQVDNEPNEVTVSDRWRYAEKVAYVMNGITSLEGAGKRLAVGTPPMGYASPSIAVEAANLNHLQGFFRDMMWNLRWLDRNVHGGRVFKNAFIATHPYDKGEPGGGAVFSDWFRDTAGAIAERTFTTLATEGGNPIRPSDPDAVWIIEDDLRSIEWRPNLTQCLWLAGERYLTNNPSAAFSDWEPDAFYRFDGTVSLVPRMLREYASGMRR